MGEQLRLRVALAVVGLGLLDGLWEGDGEVDTVVEDVWVDGEADEEWDGEVVAVGSVRVRRRVGLSVAEPLAEGLMEGLEVTLDAVLVREGVDGVRDAADAEWDAVAVGPWVQVAEALGDGDLTLGVPVAVPDRDRERVAVFEATDGLREPVLREVLGLVDVVPLLDTDSDEERLPERLREMDPGDTENEHVGLHVAEGEWLPLLLAVAVEHEHVGDEDRDAEWDRPLAVPVRRRLGEGEEEGLRECVCDEDVLQEGGAVWEGDRLRVAVREDVWVGGTVGVGVGEAENVDEGEALRLPELQDCDALRVDRDREAVCEAVALWVRGAVGGEAVHEAVRVRVLRVPEAVAEGERLRKAVAVLLDTDSEREGEGEREGLRRGDRLGVGLGGVGETDADDDGGVAEREGVGLRDGPELLRLGVRL